MQRLLKSDDISLEGLIIFSTVGYETVALTANFLAGRKVLPPITDILGPLTHSKLGKLITWAFLGWAWDHFYKKGEELRLAKLLSDLNGE
jgi:hypothetical protein